VEDDTLWQRGERGAVIVPHGVVRVIAGAGEDLIAGLRGGAIKIADERCFALGGDVVVVREVVGPVVDALSGGVAVTWGLVYAERVQGGVEIATVPAANRPAPCRPTTPQSPFGSGHS